MKEKFVHRATLVRKEVFRCENDRYVLLRIRVRDPFSADPGQFVMVDTGSVFFLDRPFSILDMGEGFMYLLVRIKGFGTESLLRWKEGGEIELKGPFGNPIGREVGNDKNVHLIAGGIGIVPLYYYVSVGTRAEEPGPISLFFGAGSRSVIEELGGRLLLSGLSDDVELTTVALREDGKTVVDAYGEYLDAGNSPGHIIACGPNGMLEAVQRLIVERNLEGELVLEEKMACGRGMCMGCPVEIKENGITAVRKVCTDGPSFTVGRGREVVFR